MTVACHQDGAGELVLLGELAQVLVELPARPQRRRYRRVVRRRRAGRSGAGGVSRAGERPGAADGRRWSDGQQAQQGTSAQRPAGTGFLRCGHAPHCASRPAAPTSVRGQNRRLSRDVRGGPPHGGVARRWSDPRLAAMAQLGVSALSAWMRRPLVQDAALAAGLLAADRTRPGTAGTGRTGHRTSRPARTQPGRTALARDPCSSSNSA
jgi:hypothetical protein